MHPSWRFQEFDMDKNVFRPPPSTSSGNSVGDFSRKNNMISGQPSHSTAAMIGSRFSGGPNDKLNGICRNNIVNGIASNQPEELLDSRYFNENGYSDESNFVAPWLPSEKNLQETSGNAICSSLGQLQSDQWEEPSLAKVSTLLSTLQGQINQLKAYASSEITGKSHNENQAQDFPSYGQSGHLNSNFNFSGEIPNLSSILPLSVENLQKRSLDLGMSSVGLKGQTCFQESSNTQAQCGASRGLDSSNISIGGRQLPEFHKEHVNGIFVQTQPPISSGCAGSFSTNNAVKGDTEFQKTFSSAASSLIQPMKEESSAKKVETDLSICRNNLKTRERTSSIKAYENVACKARKKLWNGTLQLSSSVQLSTAAYFKSGDKMPDLYWSDSVEVKGKVKLEAFEKYIEDLARSRNRGLMVMSLCLREGSSEDGLKAMNEVIKKYKTGKRVGRAQLSPGVDVYVCPNSEAIITILAKNGFSKGSVSVQDHQDSLIGCAVWRKNLSSDPGSRKLGNQSLSAQPSSSSPNSIPQQVTGSDSSSAKAEAIQQASAEAPATNGVFGNNCRESKNAESSAHREVGSSSSSPSPGASANLHSTMLDGPPSDVHAIHNIVKQLTEIEASIFRSLGVEKLQGNLQLLRTILPLSSEVAVKHPVPATEDDDLPEYDFGAAVPHASTSNPSDAVAVKKLSDGEFRPKNELVAPSQMRVEAQKDVYGGPLVQKRKIINLSIQEEQANMTTGNKNELLGSKIKNLFDEDDMPEWQPPDIKHFKASSTDQTTRPPFIPNTFRPPHSETALLPPLPFTPAGRPQHGPYNTKEPIDHNGWNRHLS